MRIEGFEMNILVVGNPNSQDEFKGKFGLKHQVIFKTSQELTENDLLMAQAIFDFEIGAASNHGNHYRVKPDAVLFLNSVTTTVSKLVASFGWTNPVIGFNGWTGMFHRPLLELSSNQPEHVVRQICTQLGTDFRLVEDQIGMVSPRVISMIINEAYYTLEEGTANEADIDLAMKLGTNYPAGPFEMASTIGLSKVCQLLDTLYSETSNPRYQVCPLLKQRSLDK